MSIEQEVSKRGPLSLSVDERDRPSKRPAIKNDDNDVDDDTSFCHSTFLTKAQRQALHATAAALATPGKGISACDESAGTIGKRFAAVSIANNTVENRRAYRQMLFTAPGCEQYLCGVILDPETLTQSADDGTLFTTLLAQRGIVPGVKPHLKVYELPGTGGDTVMQGLDSLAVRCREYHGQGARFAKWRSPLQIDTAANRPTALAIRSNMQDLARYALICQANGLLPIVEPDVSLQGNHSLEEAVQVNITVQSELFYALRQHGVYLPGVTLKTNLVNPGVDCTAASYSVEQIAQANWYVLQNTVPTAIQSVNFLSGGQDLATVAARLSALNRCAKKHGRACPWTLSFSWSQALQLPLLQLCTDNHGKFRLDEMAKLYVEELKMASAASKGEYQWKDGDGDHNVS